jgi:hypothetical protein
MPIFDCRKQRLVKKNIHIGRLFRQFAAKKKPKSQMHLMQFRAAVPPNGRAGSQIGRA